MLREHLQGATVRVEFYKVHCGNYHSDHFIEEGTTGANGVFSTELQAVYNTLYFGNTDDFLTVQVAGAKGGMDRQPPTRLPV